MKTCTECGSTKHETEFHRHRGFTDGRRTKCKSCAKEQFKSYYERNKERHKKVVKRWQKDNPGRVSKYRRKSTEKKEVVKELVKRKIGNEDLRLQSSKLLFRGYLKKAECCQACGDKTDALIPHEPSSFNAKRAIWLCQPCKDWIIERQIRQELKKERVRKFGT